MKGRKRLIVAIAGLVGWANYASSQVPGIPIIPGNGLPGIGPGPAAPTPPKTLWGFLGVSKEQREFCLRKICKTPLGQLLNNSSAPLQALSGGLIPPFCPLTPSLADLADPGAVGAASKIMLDEAGAKARRAAVRYLGTVDCHYWPEAEEALIGALRGDRNECVRYEAALALGSGCCCTKKTIEALTIVVSCSDRDSAPKETSERVHAAARMALDHCMACFKAPAPPPKIEKPIPEGGLEGEKIKIEIVPPPVTPPIANDSAEVKPAGGIVLGEAKPFSPPSEAKPLVNGGVMQAVAKTTKPGTRPVGFEYYAMISQTPMAPILAEARRVAAAVPLPSSPAGDRSLVAMMEQAKFVTTAEKAETGEPNAEVVSARPSNLWDMMAAKSLPAKPAAPIAKAKEQPPLVLPMVADKPAMTKPTLSIVETKEFPALPLMPPVIPAMESKPAQQHAVVVPTFALPEVNPAMSPPAVKPAPLPMPASIKPVENQTRGGLLNRTLTPFNASTSENPASRPSFSPLMAPCEAPPTKPAIRPLAKAVEDRPFVTLSETPQSKPTIRHIAKAVEDKPIVTLSESPQSKPAIRHIAKAVEEKPIVTLSESPQTKPAIRPLAKAVEEKASKSVVKVTLDDRPVSAPCTPAKHVVNTPCSKCDEPSRPVTAAYSAPMPALPTLPTTPPKQESVAITTPVVATDRAQKVLVLLHNPIANDARLQSICSLDAADLASSSDLVDKLLSTARRSKDETERKACIQAMVRGKVTQPEVFATLGLLSKDPVATVRVEATIGLARLRVMAAN